MFCVKNGLLHTVKDKEPFFGDILLKDGKIASIGNVESFGGVEIIDASGAHIYPGLVEAHCHLGLDGYAVRYEGQDYNERTDPVTPQLEAIDAFNPQDVTIKMAAEAGVTTVGTGPGSSNILGGTFIAVKTYGNRADDMIIKRKAAMKCAFGENPKFCYKEKDITSRMTTAAKLREEILKAKEYIRKKEAAGDDYGKRPPFDFKLEALAPVVKKEIPLKAHAHRADDIFTAIRLAKELDVGLTLEHCTEGHLIAEYLAKEGTPVAVGPTFGHATKFELKNKSFETQ
jgi:imidazolonepropionase-like amidohydrolase